MTKASDNLFPKVILNEAATDGSDFTNPSADYRVLFLGEDGSLHLKDSAGSVTTVGGGIADQGAFTYLDATEAAAPGTPASGKVRIYAKSDGRIYSKDDTGTEYGPFDEAGAGSTPLLYVDSIALHADGDDFTSTSLSGWTVNSIGTPTAVTTEVYDDTCLSITFDAQGDYMYKAKPSSSDFEISLTIAGMTNDTPSPTTATNAMIGLFMVDNSGNGTGFSLYSTGAEAYMWGLTSWIYASSGSSITGLDADLVTASGMAVVYKLKKVGTTITGSLSYNGGASWFTQTRTDSTTFTRVGIGRFYTGGGGNPKAVVGRFNVTEL